MCKSIIWLYIDLVFIPFNHINIRIITVTIKQVTKMLTTTFFKSVPTFHWLWNLGKISGTYLLYIYSVPSHVFLDS